MALAEEAPVDNTDAVVETVRHAIRCVQKAAALRRQAEEAIAVAASLAGEYGERANGDALRHLAREAQLADIPGRRVLTEVARRAQAGAPWRKTGSKKRGSRDWWPPPAEVVYMLFDRAGAVLYVGKTCNLQQRMEGHCTKPWAETHWWVCVDRAEASRLEADLIYQHQPPLNRAARDRRLEATA